jgi:predicted metal-dependent hydrolase
MAQAGFPVRDFRFSTGSEVPRHWQPAGAAVTRFFDNLSLFFPNGERFFVEAVKSCRDQVRDPNLAEEVRAFIGQEAMHTREHLRYNEMLEAQGLPARKMQERVGRLLARVRRTAPPMGRLAITAALEHFTALMAHMALEKEGVFGGAHPTMAALWRWHALEEGEHKHVAFDVYRSAGGSYLRRVAAMIGATVVFWAKVTEHQIRLMHADGILFSVSEWRSLWRFLFVSPGALRGLLRRYLTYYRPSFHPKQLEDRALRQEWRAALETLRAT